VSPAPGGPEAPGGPGRQGAAASGLLTTVFLFLLAGYVILFYRAEFAAGVPRYQPLAYALVPDELVRQWCGGGDHPLSIVDRLPLIGVAIAIWVSAFSFGWLVLKVLRVERVLHRLELVVFAVGLGLSGLSLTTLAVGLVGGLRRPTWLFAVGGVLVAALIWNGRTLFKFRTDAGSRGEDACREGERPAWWRPRWCWLAVPLVAAVALGSTMPPIDFDVLEYHLQVPKEWYQQGRVTFLPHNVYGNMPLGAECLSMMAMACMPGELDWWWGALTGKLIIAGFLPATALLVFSAGRRFFTDRAGAVGSLLYLSTPWVASVSVNGLNDGAVAFYLMAAAYAAKLWLDRREAGGADAWGLLATAGLCAGSAVACKYSAVLFVVLPLVLLALWKGGRRRAGAVCCLLLAVSVSCGPWFGKNWVLAGNPTYPLLVGVFGGETRTAERDVQWRRAHQVPRDPQGARYSPRQLWEAFLQVSGRSRWHHPLLVPLAGLIVLRGRGTGSLAYWLGGLAWVLATWWLFTHRIDRFWVPALPLLAVIAGVAATWSSSIVWRRALGAVLVAGLLANFLLVSSALVGDNRYFVQLASLRDDPALSYGSPAHRYLNQHVSPGRCALLVGDAAVFDLRVPVLYNTCFDACVFEDVFRDRSRTGRIARLRELAVSHVYVNWAELDRYRRPGNYGYSDYITRQLVHEELVRAERVLRPVHVPELDVRRGEVFEVVAATE